MIFESSEFVFEAPSPISRARRVLIKPSASYPVPYPVTTSRDILSVIIEGIRPTRYIRHWTTISREY